MSEPEIDYCTVRCATDEKGIDSFHIECRFKDGQKFAPIEVDGEFPDLADDIAKFLNERTKVVT